MAETMRGLNDALSVLNGRARRKLANNTYLESRGEGKVALKLHATDILLFDEKGVEYQTGGWQTRTTKERMNRFGPAGVWSEKGIWYIKAGKSWREEQPVWPYSEGCRWEAGEILGCALDADKETRKLRDKVRKYCGRYMAAFVKGEVPAPGTGDCCYCYLRGESGKPLGEEIDTLHADGKLTKERNPDHILSHLEESYYVPSLLARALEVGRVSKSMIWWLGAHWDDGAKPELRESIKARDMECGGFERKRMEKVLRGYVLRQLGLGR